LENGNDVSSIGKVQEQKGAHKFSGCRYQVLTELAEVRRPLLFLVGVETVSVSIIHGATTAIPRAAIMAIVTVVTIVAFHAVDICHACELVMLLMLIRLAGFRMRCTQRGNSKLVRKSGGRWKTGKPGGKVKEGLS
jgi:hypothetical protein